MQAVAYLESKFLWGHVILIGIFGTVLLNASLPAVVKYLLLIISTYIGSNLLVSAYYAGKRALGE